jgi:oligoendopeptidase F
MLGKLIDYAQLQSDTDTTNQQHAALIRRVRTLLTTFNATTAFARPELLALDTALLERFMTEEPALQSYRHFFHELQRQGAHIQSAALEDTLARANEPLALFHDTYRVLTNGELTFAPISDAQGTRHQIARGTIDKVLSSPDRTLRKAAWESYADGFLAVKNTLAMLFCGHVNARTFQAHQRAYPSALAAALDTIPVPTAVYQAVVDSCIDHLPLWHRYWDIRRRALQQEHLEICDITAPLTTNQPDVPYTQAVAWICDGMAPLGDEYVQVLRAGLTHDRWVDIYPNIGKRSGAYSRRAYASPHPFILLNYTNSLIAMSSLAHEAGHAMHAYYTNHNQPYIYSHYTLFVAEVASNFNQALVRAALFQHDPNRDFQVAVLEEALRNVYRYLFLMPILSRFEQRIYEQVEQQQALTANGMANILLELFTQGYGPAFVIDQERAGITWAQFNQLYRNFYVFQYASGIAAAITLADKVLSGESGAVERYLTFLKAGDSLPPLDALRLAGVDMTSPEPMQHAFRVVERYIDRLDHLI